MGHPTAEDECEIVAAQDQVLQTKYLATKIFYTETANADCIKNFMRQ
jgi:hypothetical protein